MKQIFGPILRWKISTTNSDVRLRCIRWGSSKVKPVLSWQRVGQEFLEKTAVVEHPPTSSSNSSLPLPTRKHSYKSLFLRGHALAKQATEAISPAAANQHNDDTHNHQPRTVAVLCPNDASYVVSLLACWANGWTAVPLFPRLPFSQLEYFLNDSKASLLITSGSGPLRDTASELCAKLNLPLCHVPQDGEGQEGSVEAQLPSAGVSMHLPALVLYTSGTTGPPKGVVLTHSNLCAQSDALVKAWHLGKQDGVLHCLPLHHIHGVVNALLTPLSVGATVHMMERFNAFKVWQLLTSSTPQSTSLPVSSAAPINCFMGVPTMYAKLLEEYDRTFLGKDITQAFIQATCKDRMRLFISGSSSLPQPIFDRWSQISGHHILERYGMTEIGMALSNPVEEDRRRPGFVGTPLPKMKVCVARPNVYSPRGYDVICTGDEWRTTPTSSSEVGGRPEDLRGELFVQGPGVFREYLRRPDDTKAAFTSDGWFKTGDSVQVDVDGGGSGVYKILGRTSVDIIKSGGYKISALDVERHLLAHPDVAECAVVGLSDITWGQKVAAIVVPSNQKGGRGRAVVESSLREWCKLHLAPYAVPSVFQFVDELPRSAIGKVNKKELVRDVFHGTH